MHGWRTRPPLRSCTRCAWMARSTLRVRPGANCAIQDVAVGVAVRHVGAGVVRGNRYDRTLGAPGWRARLSGCDQVPTVPSKTSPLVSPFCTSAQASSGATVTIVHSVRLDGVLDSPGATRCQLCHPRRRRWCCRSARRHRRRPGQTWPSIDNTLHDCFCCCFFFTFLSTINQLAKIRKCHNF